MDGFKSYRRCRLVTYKRRKIINYPGYRLPESNNIRRVLHWPQPLPLLLPWTRSLFPFFVFSTCCNNDVYLMATLIVASAVARVLRARTALRYTLGVNSGTIEYRIRNCADYYERRVVRESKLRKKIRRKI